MTMGDRIAVMNNGVLEQCGDPETIYERPANVFVAGFIGSPAMSFLDYVEALGRETFVGVSVEGTQLVVHHDGRAALLPGDRLHFGLVPAGLRYFDRATGLALAAEPQPSTTPSI
jgi:ABC-type sugar transport system ATPase subunit